MRRVSTAAAKRRWRGCSGRCVVAWQCAWYLLTVLLVWCNPVSAQANKTQDQFELNDSHFHLTNYVQQGTDIHKFLEIMGTKVGRVALFGIPLQQQWSYRVDGDSAPTNYLNKDAPQYY